MCCKQHVKNMFNKYYVAIMHGLSPDCIEKFGATKLNFPTFMKT